MKELVKMTFTDIQTMVTFWVQKFLHAVPSDIKTGKGY